MGIIELHMVNIYLTKIAAAFDAEIYILELRLNIQKMMNGKKQK